jgi:hypothetical protein
MTSQAVHEEQVISIQKDIQTRSCHNIKQSNTRGF